MVREDKKNKNKASDIEIIKRSLGLKGGKLK